MTTREPDHTAVQVVSEWIGPEQTSQGVNCSRCRIRVLRLNGVLFQCTTDSEQTGAVLAAAFLRSLGAPR